MKSFFAAPFCLLLLLVTGCANTLKMPLQSDGAPNGNAFDPIYLMAVSVRNEYKKRFQPEIKIVQVVKESSTKPELFPFKMDSQGTYEGEDGEEPPTYLTRMQLPPGQYVVRGMFSQARAFPVIGNFYLPLHAPLTVEGTGVVYLGHVTATVRERQDDEFKAGASIPLIDQAIAGASGGTFDVVVSDRYDEDVAIYRKFFPKLAGQPVRKSILPPFDRAKAQAWWNAN